MWATGNEILIDAAGLLRNFKTYNVFLLNHEETPLCKSNVLFGCGRMHILYLFAQTLRNPG